MKASKHTAFPISARVPYIVAGHTCIALVDAENYVVLEVRDHSADLCRRRAGFVVALMNLCQADEGIDDLFSVIRDLVDSLQYIDHAHPGAMIGNAVRFERIAAARLLLRRFGVEI